MNEPSGLSGILEPAQFAQLQRTILVGHILEGAISGALHKFGKIQITDAYIRDNMSEGAVALADDCLAKMNKVAGQISPASQVQQQEAA